MRAIQIRLTEETLDRLDEEREAFGFDDRASYIRWLVDNRTRLTDDERDMVLGAAADRIERLEEYADRLRDGSDADPGGRDDGDGETVYVSGSVGEVQRVSDDSLYQDADELGGVHDNRLDEITRRAVADTRDRLGRRVETGLEYASATPMAGDGAPPGADLVDLDSIDVPGRSEAVRADRRQAVGAALALLRDRREARRSTFVAELYEEYPGGYDSRSGWWACIRDGLRQVDLVDDADESDRIWRYAGER